MPGVCAALGRIEGSTIQHRLYHHRVKGVVNLTKKHMLRILV
jgi:hypothetical protein